MKHTWKLAIFLSLVGANLPSAVADTQIYKFSFQGKTVNIPFMKVKGFLVNDLCKKNLSKCEAYLAASVKAARTTPAPSRFAGNPSSAYCDQLGGAALDLTDEHQNQTGFCGFKDQTMIESWSLYAGRKH